MLITGCWGIVSPKLLVVNRPVKHYKTTTLTKDDKKLKRLASATGDFISYNARIFLSVLFLDKLTHCFCLTFLNTHPSANLDMMLTKAKGQFGVSLGPFLDCSCMQHKSTAPPPLVPEMPSRMQ
jgi:hypothetical protein